MTGSAKCQLAKDKNVRLDMQHISLTNHWMITVPESVSFSWLVRKFPVLYAHRNLNAVFTRFRIANYIYIYIYLFIYLRTISLPLSAQLGVGLSRGFIPSCVLANILCTSVALSLSLSLSLSISILTNTKCWDARFRILMKCTEFRCSAQLHGQVLKCSYRENSRFFYFIFSALSFSNQLILYFVIPVYWEKSVVK